MALTKATGDWFYQELTALPDDQTRYEIIDGELFEMPAPTLAHALTIAARSPGDAAGQPGADGARGVGRPAGSAH